MMPFAVSRFPPLALGFFGLGIGCPGAGAHVPVAAIGVPLGERALGFWHIITGLWLMYLMVAVAFDFSLGWSLTV